MEKQTTSQSATGMGTPFPHTMQTSFRHCPFIRCEVSSAELLVASPLGPTWCRPLQSLMSSLIRVQRQEKVAMIIQTDTCVWRRDLVTIFLSDFLAYVFPVCNCGLSSNQTCQFVDHLTAKLTYSAACAVLFRLKIRGNTYMTSRRNGEGQCYGVCVNMQCEQGRGGC